MVGAYSHSCKEKGQSYLLSIHLSSPSALIASAVHNGVFSIVKDHSAAWENAVPLGDVSKPTLLALPTQEIIEFPNAESVLPSKVSQAVLIKQPLNAHQHSCSCFLNHPLLSWNTGVGLGCAAR